MVSLCSWRAKGRTGENELRWSGQRGEVDASFSGGGPRVCLRQR